MRTAFLLFLVCLFASCDKMFLGSEEAIVSLDENLNTPAALGDGWEVSSPELQNVDASKIDLLVRNIQVDPRNLHSMLIVRNNKLIMEAYFDGWHRDRLHELRSVTKSINAALVGIAIDKKYIPDVHQWVFGFFPEYADLKTDQKNEVRIEHLLTMSAGFQWDQSTYPNDDARNDEGAMERSDDWLRYVLSKDLTSAPGQTFDYNSGCANLLAGVIKKSTGDQSDVFAEKYLFKPLGITNYFWRKQGDGLCNGAAGLALRPRDMAKIGQLFLDSGKWKGEQVVSASWVMASTATLWGGEEEERGYGYQWWTARYTINNKVIRVFSARGNGGQNIFVVPALNAVVVFTAGNYFPLNQDQPFGVLRNIILPAML